MNYNGIEIFSIILYFKLKKKNNSNNKIIEMDFYWKSYPKKISFPFKIKDTNDSNLINGYFLIDKQDINSYYDNTNKHIIFFIRNISLNMAHDKTSYEKEDVTSRFVYKLPDGNYYNSKTNTITKNAKINQTIFDKKMNIHVILLLVSIIFCIYILYIFKPNIFNPYANQFIYFIHNDEKKYIKNESSILIIEKLSEYNTDNKLLSLKKYKKVYIINNEENMICLSPKTMIRLLEIQDVNIEIQNKFLKLFSIDYFLDIIYNLIFIYLYRKNEYYYVKWKQERYISLLRNDILYSSDIYDNDSIITLLIKFIKNLINYSLTYKDYYMENILDPQIGKLYDDIFKLMDLELPTSKLEEKKQILKRNTKKIIINSPDILVPVFINRLLNIFILFSILYFNFSNTYLQTQTFIGVILLMSIPYSLSTMIISIIIIFSIIFSLYFKIIGTSGNEGISRIFNYYLNHNTNENLRDSFQWKIYDPKTLINEIEFIYKPNKNCKKDIERYIASFKYKEPFFTRDNIDNIFDYMNKNSEKEIHILGIVHEKNISFWKKLNILQKKNTHKCVIHYYSNDFDYDNLMCLFKYNDLLLKSNVNIINLNLVNFMKLIIMIIYYLVSNYKVRN